MNFEEEVEANMDAMAFVVYNPPPSKAYVRLVEDILLWTYKALAQALEDKDYAKKEAKKWYLIGDFFYKKLTGWKPHKIPTLPSYPIPLSS